MPYKDKEKQREFQRNHIAQKRVQFFKDKYCDDCGSQDGLGILGAKKNGVRKFSYSQSLETLEKYAEMFPVLCIHCMTTSKNADLAVSATAHGHARGHGANKRCTSTYKSWQAMRYRCLNENAHNYCYYGGQGVKICQPWLDDFASFLADMGERPEGMTLDRINPYGNYEPTNCRWASAKEQANNKRARSA